MVGWSRIHPPRPWLVIEWRRCSSSRSETGVQTLDMKTIGKEVHPRALTENSGGTEPAGVPLYIGIDAGRRHHVVVGIGQERMENGSWERAGARRVSSNSAGFSEMLDWLQAFGLRPDQVRIGCEPTGGWCAETLVAFLERHGYRVSWLQNWALHERRRLAIGKQTKTDALDARLIARLLYERDCHGQTKGFLGRPPRTTDGLRLLVRNRARLVVQRTRYRLQLTQIQDILFPELKDFFKDSNTGPAARRLLELYPTPANIAAASEEELFDLIARQAHSHIHGARIGELQRLARGSAGLTAGLEPVLQTQRWLLENLRRVDEQVDDLEETILSVVESWPESQRLVLDSFPCMSKLRQAVLIAMMGDISGFRHDGQLRKLFGWYPETRESGTSVFSQHLGSSGNRLARREVWLWAMQLISPRCSPTPFRTYYERLRKRNMKGNVAVGHLASKLITVLFFCLRSEQPYDPRRHAVDLGLRDA